jgi:Ca-activated chloride channel family protein
MKKRLSVILLSLFGWFSATCGGVIIVNSENGTYMPECRSVKINGTVNQGVAVTQIEQVFYNNTAARQEGWFVFPVPTGARIGDFKMDINGKMMSAELLDAQKARQIYEDIVRRYKDPALMEYIGADLFRVRIFPLEPQSEKKTLVRLEHSLPKIGDLWEYTLPLSVLKKTAPILRQVDIRVDIKSSSSLKTVYSPTHGVVSERINGNQASIIFSEKNHQPQNDFRLYVGASEDKLGISTLTHKNTGEEGFFFLDVNPGYLEQTGADFPKDITFVLDCSGSMAGKSMTQARNALLFCLGKLGPSDRFDIVRFSTEAEALFGSRVVNSPENNRKAVSFVKGLQEMGGTNIQEAFDQALKEPPMQDRPHMVLFITDGKPTIGMTDGDALAAKIEKASGGNTRIFSVGIGHDLHTRLLEKISSATRGYCTYMSPEEEMEIKISDIYQKLSRPVITDIEVSFGGSSRISQVYPRKMPDLFAGSSITLFGRYDTPGNATISLKGKLRGQTYTLTKTLVLGNEDERNEFIPGLWATRKVGRLLEEIRLKGENEELKTEVVHLARKYGIITPYTSYLILEDEMQQTPTVRQQPRPLLFQDNLNDAASRAVMREEYENLKSVSGKGSTLAGNAISEMNRAESVALQPVNNLQKTRIANVAGRNFVLSNNVWEEAEPETFTRTEQICFGSEAYFSLALRNREIARMLALGNNVAFVYNRVKYVVGD